MDIAARARSEFDEIRRLRRDFHAHPELSFQEERTSRAAAEYLEGLGLTLTRPRGMHGFWADLEVPGAGETLLFRADMDALAMDEAPAPTKEAFLSREPGMAHCCGHDAHTAMLLGAARLLASGKVKPRRNVRFLFQHAEESPPGGAAELIEAGCLEGVDLAFGLHVLPQVPSGCFALLAGPVMAAADNFTILVRGRGGHAAMPHLLRDPVPAAAQVVTALQALVSRRADPLESLVISIATIRGGSGTHNVIPSTVELKGTARTLSKERRAGLPRLLEETAAAAAATLGCRAETDYQEGYPVLANDPGAFERGRKIVLELFGPEALFPGARPLMGGEDFARYAQVVPSLFAFLGTGAPEKGISAPLHSPRFDLDEEALPRGTAWFAGLASL